MQAKSAVIRIRVNGEKWETIGTDREAQVWVENLNMDWDSWGSKSATFDLKRDPISSWPDLVAYNDVEIEVSGAQVWKGRIQGTPSRTGTERSISVQCEGLQAHLDDDVFRPAYVHTSLTDWIDIRSHPKTNLALYQANWDIQVGSGYINIGLTDNTPASFPRGGVLFDAGPGLFITDFDLAFENSAWSANSAAYYSITNSLSSSVAFSLLNFNNSAGTGTASGTASTPGRYMIILCDTDGAQTGAFFKITECRLVTAGSYIMGLYASEVVDDALNKGTSLLSSDRSLITDTLFNIPDLYSKDYRTPREVISGVNAYHDYISKVDEHGRFVFQPKPASPIVEVGEFTALEVEDASGNSGEDIYSRVFVSGTSPTGIPVSVERTQAQQANVVLAETSNTATNPGFESNTTGWSTLGVGYGTIARTTVGGEFSTGVAGGKWSMVSFGDELAATFAGTYNFGTTYILKLNFRVVNSTGFGPYRLSFGKQFVDVGTATIFPTAGFVTYTMSWSPTVTHTSGVTLRIQAPSFASTSTSYIDNVLTYSAAPTLVNRRGFRRTKVLQVDSVLGEDGIAAGQIGDLWLSNHKTAQFKGSANIVGPVRHIKSGRSVPPEQLGLHTGGLLRFNNRIDPDTGALGRDGRIATVSYNLAADQANVTVDNTSQNFEVLLSRLGALSAR